MNKLKLWICILAALLAVGIVFLMIGGDSTGSEPNGQIQAPGDPGVTVGPGENQSGYAPAETEDKLFGSNKTEETKSTEPPAAPTEDKENPTAPTKAPEQTKPADDPMAETGVQPESGETLPPDVDVSMGVVDGESVKDIEDTNSGTSGGSAQPPKETEPPKTTEPPKSTESTNPPATNPPSDANNPLGDDFDLTLLTYESYMAMTGEQQEAVVDEFSSPEMFLKWFKAAEAKYKEEHPDIEIDGDGTVDGSEIG